MIMLNFSLLFTGFNHAVKIIITDKDTRRNNVRKFCSLLEKVFLPSVETENIMAELLNHSSFSVRSARIVLEQNKIQQKRYL